mmetsp:Transcript_17798/g.53713  ORF Transcript_17798/g.53713 Transcript_17798/m.53713 type:complete len:209 (-) Transcript_17798:687-1313(-)
MIASASARSATRASPLGSFPPSPPGPPGAKGNGSPRSILSSLAVIGGGVSTTAWARATSTVCSASPMRILPCNARTMYCASEPCAATSICLIFSFLRVMTSLPDALASSMKLASTLLTIKGLGFPNVICLRRALAATTPKSPSSSSCVFTASTLLPHVSATALIMMVSPTPSSKPSYEAAILLVATHMVACSCWGEVAITVRKQFAIN